MNSVPAVLLWFMVSLDTADQYDLQYKAISCAFIFGVIMSDRNFYTLSHVLQGVAGPMSVVFVRDTTQGSRTEHTSEKNINFELYHVLVAFRVVFIKIEQYIALL